MVFFLVLSLPFLSGLSGPDGLCPHDSGVYLCEETAGEVVFVSSDARKTVVTTGLRSPEGVCVEANGKLLVVEDVPDGRLVELSDGFLSVLAGDLNCPEGVTVDNDGIIWFTTGGLQGGGLLTALWKLENGVAIPEYSLPSTFSFSDLEPGNDGMLYVCSETSGIIGNTAVFRFDPTTSTMVPFVTGVPACEGIGTTGGSFPFYIVSEPGEVFTVDSTGVATLFAETSSTIEDVAVFDGYILVSEDGTGSILKIETNE